MQNLKNATLYALFLSLVMIMGNACGDDDHDDGDTAAVRVIHASPDAPPVDVYVSGETAPIIEDLGYGDISDYVRLAGGPRDFEIRPAGAARDAEPAFEQQDILLERGSEVTVLAVGLLESDRDQDRFRLEVVEEAAETPGADTAAIRVVHASPDAPTVTIDVDNDATPEIGGLERFTTSDSVEVPAGEELQIGIWAGDPLERVTAFTIPALAEDTEVFIVATGLLDRVPREQDGFSLLVVGPSGSLGQVTQNPTVFVLHGIPDAPAVDLYEKETLVASDLNFGNLADPIQVQPGTLEIIVVEAGQAPSAMPLATLTTPSLEAGQRYLATAAGFSENIGEGPQIIMAVEDFALDEPDIARLAFVHASPDAPAVDLSTVSGEGLLNQPLLARNLDFGKVSPEEEGISVAPNTLMMGIAPATTREPIATFDLETRAGMRVFAVVMGALFPGEAQEPLAVFLVETSDSPWTVSVVPLMQDDSGNN